MYQLFILGELMDGYVHGYSLQERLKNAVGPTRQISSGTLYPLLARLVDHGWICSRLDEQQKGGRARKLYEITEAGREQFFQLMKSPLEHNADTGLMFHFKLIYFGHVSRKVQLACLEQYLDYLEYELEYVNVQLELFSQKEIIKETKRRQILRMMEHRYHINMANVEWVNKEMKRLRKT